MLEGMDQGRLFHYVPMQDQLRLQDWSITAADCEAGMILLEDQTPEHRWQGSAAAEKIATLLPGGAALIAAYRAIPGLKELGDRTYSQVRDHRYQWFGQSPSLYCSVYPAAPAGAEISNSCSSCQISTDC